MARSRVGNSVLVRDLVAESTFESGDGFGQLRPDVTVILPTFRRGDSGMLRACIDSVLAQSHENFELIIIDDGSTDSTRTIIEEYLAADARVATIRHPRNIGLPAVSCDEGILRARADKTFFTFDDNTMEEDALETLLNASAAHPEAHFVYGEVYAPYPGHDRTEGSGEFSYARLYEQNIIGNGAVLIDREVFERCGLYDPHILITRLCDWDLWLRITREFEPLHVDKVIAVENGRTQVDSLGNSHTLDRSVVEEWIATDRNESLRPEAFLDYDVAAVPDIVTELSQAKIRAFVRRFFIGDSAAERADGYLLLVCEEFTDELQRLFVRNRDAVRVVGITYFQIDVSALWDLMLGARVVVFADSITRAEVTARLLRVAGKAYDYYVTETADGLLSTPGGILQDFFSGVRRIIRRRGENPRSDLPALQATEQVTVERLARWPSDADSLGWTTLPLERLFASERPPDVLEILAMANTIMQSSPPSVEVAPDGYYRPRELAVRVARQLRRRPWSIFRYLGVGIRSLRNRTD